MSLREELARRLQDVGASVPTGDLGGVDINNEDVLSAIVEEVLRQMRWAHMSAKWANPETMTWEDEVLEDGDQPLTLAPPEWKP